MITQGSFTGPRLNWSGSSLRTEAMGYGLVILLFLSLSNYEIMQFVAFMKKTV